MKLSDEDVELFYKLYHSLWFYVNMKLNLIDDINSPNEFFKCSQEEIMELRDELFKTPQLIDSFIDINPMNFSPDELEIIKSWKNFIKEKLLIFRYLKNYTIFLDTNNPPKAYGVLALRSYFDEMLGSDLPIMVEAVLLPFKESIIYDSILPHYPIIFGGDMRSDFNNIYQEAKFRYGIITSLNMTKELENSNVDILRFYLRNERNREIYWQEIDDLVNSDPEFLKIYHQETEKSHVRKYSRKLRDIGVNTGWFAILGGIIIASGSTEAEVKKILKNILPDEKKDFAYIFQLKRK
jgi:hypothetical protein